MPSRAMGHASEVSNRHPEDRVLSRVQQGALADPRENYTTTRQLSKWAGDYDVGRDVLNRQIDQLARLNSDVRQTLTSTTSARLQRELNSMATAGR